MKNNIIKLEFASEKPDVMLENAKGKYKTILILGYDHDGKMQYTADTKVTAEGAVWLMESVKLALLEGIHLSENE